MRLLAAIAVLAMLGSPQPAKGPVPTISFFLVSPTFTKKNFAWYFEMATTPASTVIGTTADRTRMFALIPQEGGQWELQRLSGWQTGSPTIEKLAFAGDVPLNRNDYVRGGMIASPDGRYLIVRIFVLDTVAWKRSAIVLLIDLNTFSVVWRRSIDDPLVANARWRFLDANTLIAVGGPSPTHQGHPVIRLMISQDILRMNPVSPGEHEAGILSLPDLQITSRCSYRVRDLSRVGGLRLRSMQAEFDENGCAGVMKAGNAASFTELPGLRQLKSHFAQPFGQGCDLEDGDASGPLSLFNCRKGSLYKPDDFHISEEEERVIRNSEGSPVELAVPLKPWEDYSAALASADGHDYLVMRRGKLRIEAYEIR